MSIDTGSKQSLQSIRKLAKDIGNLLCQVDEQTGKSVFPRDRWQEDLFNKTWQFKEKSLSEGILCLVLQIELEMHDADFHNTLNSCFNTSGVGIPFRDIKSLEYCWTLAQAIVEILNRYSKSHGHLDYYSWTKMISHDEFAEIVNFMLCVHSGIFPPAYHPDEVIDIIENTWNYDDLMLPIKYLNLIFAYTAEHFPKPSIRKNPELIEICANLTKFSCISLPDEPSIGVVNGIFDILLWDPTISLPALCKSYFRGVVDTDVFCLDTFYDALADVSSKLPGKLHDQLNGLAFTSSDEVVRNGALELLEYTEDWED